MTYHFLLLHSAKEKTTKSGIGDAKNVTFEGPVSLRFPCQKNRYSMSMEGREILKVSKKETVVIIL